MNDLIKPAEFNFESFKIVRFLYEDPIGEEPQSLSVKFDPHGSYKQEDGVFILTFEFAAIYNQDSTEKELVNAIVSAVFRFLNKPLIENIPEYFYGNSIAIVYPHIRALVSTLTALANVKHVILPLYNLTGLGILLKEKTKVV